MESRSGTKPYIDITEKFFKDTSAIQHGEIIKSPSFSLMEGTNALEVLNPKLDTGILELSSDESEFDVTAPRDVESVLWVCNEIMKALATWLDNNSLSTSLLSCRYVEELLVNNAKLGLNRDIRKVGFTNTYLDNTDDEYLLVHKVLRAYTIGLSKFVSFVLNMGAAGVVYTDEDMNVQTMDLDFCQSLPFLDVIAEIDEATEWLGQHDGEAYAALVQMMHMLSSLLSVPSILGKNLQLYSENNAKLDLSYLELGRQIALDLGNNHDFFKKLKPVSGCFSVGVQKRLNNRSPPKPLVMEGHQTAYSEIARMLEDTKRAMRHARAADVSQVLQLNNAFANYRAPTEDEDDRPTNHVVARALLQLFYIRDDKSIMGGSATLTDLLIDDMNLLSCCGTPAFGFIGKAYLPAEYEQKLPEIQPKVIELLTQIEDTYFMHFSNISQNSSRQRQHLNKSVLAWDTLHVMAEKLEIELEEEHDVHDCFRAEDGTDKEPLLPISSWVYYYKLKSMLDIILKGIDLGVYKEWELPATYWYAAHLNDYLDAHISRLGRINQSRVEKITAMSKRLKKLKAGEKKQKLKELYQFKMEHEMPTLQKGAKRIEYLQFDSNVTRLMVERQRDSLALLYSLDVLQPPKHSRASEAMLFALQSKPFSSIGVPDTPQFALFTSHRAEITKTLRSEVRTNPSGIALKRYFQHIQDLGEKADTLIQYVIDEIESGEMDAGGLSQCKEDAVEWYKQLKASNATQNIVMKVLQRKLQDKTYVSECFNGSRHVEMTIRGCHRFFPVCKII